MLTSNFSKFLQIRYFGLGPSIQRPQFFEFSICLIQNFFPNSRFSNFRLGGFSRHQKSLNVRAGKNVFTIEKLTKRADVKTWTYCDKKVEGFTIKDESLVWAELIKFSLL